MGAAMDAYPLWWALSLGGNGTVIGASANVVVLGIAERNGYFVTFVGFLKVGLPVLFVTVGIGTAMLRLRFVVLA